MTSIIKKVVMGLYIPELKSLHVVSEIGRRIQNVDDQFVKKKDVPETA